MPRSIWIGMVLLVRCASEDAILPLEVINPGPRKTTDLQFEVIRSDLDSLDIPLLMKGFDNELFVLDRYDKRVEVYGTDGSWRRAIGHGIGRAPGELTNVVDISITAEHVHLTDDRERAVSRFTRGGAFKNRVSVAPLIPIRVLGVQDQIIVQPGISDSSFVMFGLEGVESGRFGDLAAGSPTSGFLDGLMVDADDEAFFIALRQASILKKYRTDGTLLTTIRTVDGIDIEDIPPAGVASSGGNTGPRRSPVEQRAIALSDDWIHIVSRRTDTSLPDEERSVLDRYDRRTGLYATSFRIPFNPAFVHVAGSQVFVLSEFTLYSAMLN